MARIKAFLCFVFTWVTGLEPGYIKRSDFFHFFRDERHCTISDAGYPRTMRVWRAEKSWYRAVSFLRGAGYCHWLFGRRVALRGFTLKLGRNLMRYESGPYYHNRVVFSPFVVEACMGGNSGHMTAEHGRY